MMEKQRVPMLRFPHFEGEWKEKKLNDISSVNPSCKNLPDEFVYIDLESVKEGILLKENRITREDSPSRAQRILLKEDILFQTVRPYQKNNYYFTKDGQYVASTGYAQIRAFSDSKFLYHSLHLETFVKKVLIRCTGTSYPAINSSDLAKIKLLIPTLPEQQKIASFFTSIDKKIELLKKKHSLLEQYKKGVMQKIFAQEIRFKDHNGNNYPDWEEKKLGECMIERNKKTPKSEQYPLMSFVAYKGVSPKGERYNREFLVSDSKGKKYKQTEYGDFIYSSNNLETGSIGLNNYGSACISPVYSIFEIRQNCSSEFIGSYFIRKKFINKMIRFRQGVVYGQWRIHESEFLKIEENIPCLQEQTKIANFLSSIDKKIEKVQLQIDKAEEWKKGLLGRMFC